MERYPIVDKDGKLVGFITSGGEFSALFDRSGNRIATYMWLDAKTGLRIDSYIRKGFLIADNYLVDVEKHLEDIPWPFVYFTGNTEDYVLWVYKQIREKIRGQIILVNFSGGKDSLATLYILSLINKYLGLELHAAYTHVSFLEPLRNIKFAEKAAKALGANFIYLEADRKLMKKRLEEEGLPFRGWRWCTYLKLKPIKLLKKEIKPSVIADGDRMAEAFKRYKRLYNMSPYYPRLLTGNRLRPIYPLTLLDVIKLVRETRLIHPDYLDGVPRVACHLCPYAVLHEFTAFSIDRLEDPGLIENAIRISYEKRYKSRGIPWEDFISQHLWRHNPETAYVLWKIKKILVTKMNNGGETINSSTVNNLYKSIWINPLPTAKVMDPARSVALFREVTGRAFDELKKHIEEYSSIGIEREAEVLEKGLN